ncbi:hypothetical protein CYMTET_24878 [Cymbomonas tetramitiformis]|uniref:Uncharacterized protein n=1 Tax=Cymbomonas tetramitiformis TaxID=36881 RepID=A0AAE0FVC5_9CHLO|nr:hypothetical protein CYMTET_24878 [Cymbomonas tetramitiformis]
MTKDADGDDDGREDRRVKEQAKALPALPAKGCDAKGLKRSSKEEGACGAKRQKRSSKEEGVRGNKAHEVPLPSPKGTEAHFCGLVTDVAACIPYFRKVLALLPTTFEKEEGAGVVLIIDLGPNGTAKWNDPAVELQPRRLVVCGCLSGVVMDGEEPRGNFREGRKS